MTPSARNFVVLLLAGLIAAVPLEAGSASANRSAGEPLKAVLSRELRRRTLTLDDTSVTMLPELHVAGGTATVLTFQVPIAEGGVIPGAVKDLFYPLAQTEKTVIVVPKADLAAPVPVSVSLKDGTVLSFKCLSVPQDADAQVDVILALRTRAPQESAAALKGTIGQLRGQLDDCKATSGDAGAQKLAALLVTQSLDQPQAFDRHRLHAAERQNRLLVEARWAYRLLGLTYIVLTVENRDPERPWILDRAEVRLTGTAENTDIQVKSAVAEHTSLPSDTAERVVVSFPTPSLSKGQKVTLTLHEKDGGRRVVLEHLDL
jgi:uncharacterized protein (TIGR02268 family)